MNDSENKSNPVRPVSREPKFTKIRALNCFEEVHQRILSGEGATAIAKFIQEDEGEYLDATRASVVSALNYYRSTLPPGELVAKQLPGEFKNAVKKLNKAVDEVKELEWLTRFQKRRLRIDGAVESNIKKLLPTMTQEVRAHVEVLRTLASVKMDLGLNKRHLGSLEVDATLVADVVGRYGSSTVAKVLQSAESRQKVMGVAERFLALAQREMNDKDEADAAAGVTVDATPSVPTKTDPDPKND
jgi:hypothetical protein